MNNQTMSNLKLKPLLGHFFHNIHIDLRDSRRKEICDCPSHKTCLGVSKCLQQSILTKKKQYNRDASGKMVFQFFRAFGRQRGKRFGVFTQVIGRTAIQLLREVAAKHGEVDSLERASPKFGQVGCCRRKNKKVAKNLWRQSLSKQLGSGSSKRFASTVTQQNMLKKAVDRDETFLKTFLKIHIKQYKLFVAGSGNLVGKVPLIDNVLTSHEVEICPSTSLDEKCFEFEFQMDRN